MRMALLVFLLVPVFGAEPKLEGTWRGTLTNAPRPTARPVEVVMEFGPAPAEGACSMWRTTYTERGEVRGVKDYKLCRKEEAGEMYIDEGEDTQLKARWIGDVLISAFKVNDLLLVTHLRVRGDVLEEEIFSIEDQPAAAQVVSLVPKSVQRLTLRRADPKK